MKKLLLTGLSVMALGLTLKAQSLSYTNDFSTVPVITEGSGAFTHTSDGSNWVVSALSGHDQYDQFDIEFPTPISFAGVNKPIVSLVASSDDSLMLEITLIDIAKKMTDNPVLLPAQPNRFAIMKGDAPKTFSYDFTGQFKDNYSDGGNPRGNVDSTQISRIRFRINVGFASPYYYHKGGNDSATYKRAFKGNLKIDKLQIGSIISGISVNGSVDKSAVYPNPSTGLVTISLDNKSTEQVAVSVTNVMGQVVFSSKVQQNDLKLDLSGNEKGIYFVKIQSSNGMTTKRLILN